MSQRFSILPILIFACWLPLFALGKEDDRSLQPDEKENYVEVFEQECPTGSIKGSGYISSFCHEFAFICE